MVDNKLELIQGLGQDTLDKMSLYRGLFVALDNELVKLGDDQHGHRQLALARTHIETALMFTIKTIAIQGEPKK